MAFDLSILAQPLAHKSNPSDFNNLTNTILDVRQDDRRDKIADSQIGRTDKANEFTDLQISQAQESIRRAGKTESMTDYAGFIVRAESLAQMGDVDGLQSLMTDRITRLEEKGKEDKTINTRNTEGLLNLLNTAPDQFGAAIASETDALTRTGFIKSITDVNGKPSLQANAPVTLVDTEGNKKLAFPVFDKNTSEARFEDIEAGEGWVISTETPEEKRLAEVQAAQQKKLESLQAELDLKPQIAAETALATAAADHAEKAFTQIDKIRTNNQNLVDARQALLDGADSGPLARLVPSFREQSVRLDAAQGRLGLDVVQSTTFGALSKGELDLSKAIALPNGLQEEALIQWIDDKMAANARMADYLERQAVFLSEKGEDGKQNTRADWIKSERAIMAAAMESIDATEEDIDLTIRETGMDRSQVMAEIRRRFESGS